MNIVITGSTGFIGRHLVEYLNFNTEFNLFLITRSKTNIKKINFKNKRNIKKFVYRNSNESLIKNLKKFKPDLLIHLATSYFQSHNDRHIKNIIDTNIFFSTKVLEAISISGCKMIINTSTGWECYRTKKSPVNLYAATKSAFDKILNYYQSSENLKVINVYLSDTYGLSDTRNKIIPSLLKNLSSKNQSNLAKVDKKCSLYISMM